MRVPSTTTDTVPPAPANRLTILTASDIDTILASLSPEEALLSQSKVFSQYSSASASSHDANEIPSIQAPLRLATTYESGKTVYMPARVKECGGTAIKLVSLPNESADSLPTTTLVLDETSGRVRYVINSSKLTALRNASGEPVHAPFSRLLSCSPPPAGSALSYQLFPPARDPTSLLIFGSGSQAYAHAHMFLKLHPSLKTLTLIVRRPTDRSTALASTLSNAFPHVSISIGISTSSTFNLSQAVHNADIIITVTPSLSPLFNSVDVRSGTHLVLVGSYTPAMHEISTDLVRRGGKIVVDSKHACLEEAGELIDAQLSADDLVEIGQLLSLDGEEKVARVKQVRQSGDVVIFKSVGIGLQDVSIADLVIREAEKSGLGTVVEDY
ncbi:hypothetical protein P7C73_g5848, partial [Tremellales sp. Uapishka_1]